MTSSGGGESARKLGRYHLVEPIGGGPTGEVFRAKVYGVAGLERQFAVKRFHAEFVKSPETSAALARSARAYGNLEHPRIARMQEFGVAGGETFAAVEMVEGIDVSRLVQNTFGAGEPLVPGAALALVKQAARAVGYAHGRGILHLGLCPTNIVCQPDGEVKVTDFGFLPPRLPARPADDLTLFARISYLAPEQLVAEETSPATDVFQLGVVLYELLTGDKPFRGASTLDISQAILSGVPRDPAAPKAVIVLLHRALARSPLERYPDAGAFADGIEAAMRATPLPGGPRDIANTVRRAIERRGQASGDQSGAFAFPMPAPPPAAGPPPRPLSAASSLRPTESPLARALKQGATPPPIPTAGAPRRTTMGVAPSSPSPPKRMPSGPVDEDAPTRVRADLLGGARASRSSESGVSDLTPLPPPLPDDPALDLDFTERESQIRRTDELATALATPTESSRQPAVQPPAEADAPEVAAPGSLELEAEEPPPGASPLQTVDIEAPTLMRPAPAPAPPAAARRGPSRALLVIAVLVALGAGGFYGYQYLVVDKDGEPPRRTARGDQPGPTPGPAPAEQRDAGAATPAAAPIDAGVPDAAFDGTLEIASTPDKAEIYLDGTKIGETPMELEDITDRHRVALIKPGYKLYVGEVAPGGRHHVELEEITPPNGRAGIKVRCRKKNRYYVILDGEDTGQLCPTERLGVTLGEHVVEIYDPVTDTRNTFRAKVEETRRSLRVRVD